MRTLRTREINNTEEHINKNKKELGVDKDLRCGNLIDRMSKLSNKILEIQEKVDKINARIWK